MNLKRKEKISIGVRLDEGVYERIRALCIKDRVFMREFYEAAFSSLCEVREGWWSDRKFIYIAHPQVGKYVTISMDKTLVYALQEWIYVDNIRKSSGYYTAIVKYLDYREKSEDSRKGKIREIGGSNRFGAS